MVIALLEKDSKPSWDCHCALNLLRLYLMHKPIDGDLSLLFQTMKSVIQTKMTGILTSPTEFGLRELEPRYLQSSMCFFYILAGTPWV